MRLHALLWDLADRWGRMTPDGVVVPLRLTHGRLGRLVRGGRPAISAALRAFAERELVHRRPDGSWLLRGEPRVGPALTLSRARTSARTR